MIDLDQLLAPIAGEAPCGTDVRQDSEGAAVYYGIKDARAAARLAERRAEAEAEGAPLSPEWRQIMTLAEDVLAHRSKDLEVAVWLTEAALRLHGYAGLRHGFALIDGLIERYWDGLHSLDPEDLSAKVAPLAGLNGVGADGALIQPLRLAPITAPGSGEPAGLWHYMVMRKRGTKAKEAALLEQAVKATSAADFKAIYADLAQAASTFTDLSHRLDALCGEASPPSSTIANTLTEAQDALRDISGLSIDLLTGEPVAAAAAAPSSVPEAASVETAAAVAPTPSGPAPLNTREDALRELARIAAFFREHEPNSTTAYTLETLIRRARLSLPELLAELIPDETVRRTYLTVAGIWPETPGRG